jgi:hypothetical protein
MKKIILSFAIAFYAVASAQVTVGVKMDQTSGLKIKFESDDTWSDPKTSTSINLGIVSGNLLFDYDLTSENFFRIQIGLKRLYGRISSEVNYELWDEKYKNNLVISQNSILFAPGIGTGYQLNKFNLYGGVQLPLELIGSIIARNESQWENPGGIGKDIINASIPGGFSAGVGAFFGAKYSLMDNLFVGGEFNYGAKYSAFGGDVSMPINMDTSAKIRTGGFSITPLTTSILVSFRF